MKTLLLLTRISNRRENSVGTAPFLLLLQKSRPGKPSSLRGRTKTKHFKFSWSRCLLTNSMPKRKIKTLALVDKVKLINEIEAKSCKKMEIAKKYGIPFSTLSTIYKNRDRVLEFARDGTEPHRKRVKHGKFPQLEEEVWKWISSVSGHKSTLTGSAIRTKAVKLAEQLGCKDFQASMAWLENFRARHNLKVVKKMILLPTQTSSLPGDTIHQSSHHPNTDLDIKLEPGDDLNPQIEFLPDRQRTRQNSAEDAIQHESSSHHPNTDLGIKLEPDDCDLNPQIEFLPDRQRSSRPSESEGNVLSCFKGISDNQLAEEPRGNSELGPTSPDEASVISTPGWSEWTNRSSNSNSSSSDFVDEGCNAANLSLATTLTSQMKDQLKCFGIYIVSKLQLMDARTCLLVQKAITDIIFEAEINALKTECG